MSGTLGKHRVPLAFFCPIISANAKGSNLKVPQNECLGRPPGEGLHPVEAHRQQQAFPNFFPSFLEGKSSHSNPIQMLFLLCFKSQRQSTTQTFKIESQTLQIGNHFKNNSVHRHLEESDSQRQKAQCWLPRVGGGGMGSARRREIWRLVAQHERT